MFKFLPTSTKRSLSTDSVSPDVDLKASNSGSSGPAAGRPGKENKRERGQSISESIGEASQTKKGTKTGTTGGAAKPDGTPPGATSAPKVIDKEKLLEIHAVHEAFEKMLDDLQIPGAIRPKLNTLEPPVKAAMLRSSQTLSFLTAISPPSSNRTLRKIRSTESIGAQPPAGGSSRSFVRPVYTPPRPGTPVRAADVSAAFSPGSPGSSIQFAEGPKNSGRKGKRPISMGDTPSKSFLSLGDTLETSGRPAKMAKPTKDKFGLLTPAGNALMLQNTKSTALDVERVKKLRILLRNEAASWTEEFLCHGGYVALLARLKDLLEVEWREEQHGDHVLHELLRCFKALSTSEIGCFALRSSSPKPFSQLVELLYSDKKPGDVFTRQAIIDLLLVLFELYPSRTSGSPRTPQSSKTAPHTSGATSSSRRATSIFPLPPGHDSVFSLVRSLLLTVPPPRSDIETTSLTPHSFISSLHIPRIYKTYLGELGDICRDYFWVFCHPDNCIWLLDEVDATFLEAPKAPSAITGAIEFEAMNYLTTHLRLINALSKSAMVLNLSDSSENSAHRLHSDLLASGFDRILYNIRKASTSHYPTLHLEIARYVTHCTEAGFELPWSISRIMGSPPTPMRKQGVRPQLPTKLKDGSPRKRPAGERPPMLPATPKLDAIQM